jgi:phosphoglycerate kinase
MKLNELKKAEIKQKRVILRADLDVPIVNYQIEDDSRLKGCLETIDLLFKNGATVLIIGHLGRPTPQFSISNPPAGGQFSISEENQKFSLKPVADWLNNELGMKNQELRKEKVGSFDGWKISSNLFLLENLRFFEGEEKNDLEFAKKLASLGDIYVNDAFAVSHRAHASIVGIPQFLPHFAGLHLEKEISVLSQILENPRKPLVLIIGGAKIETKLPLVKKMNSLADIILVGGLVAIELKKLLKENQIELSGGKANIIIAEASENQKDILAESADKFKEVLKTGKTIVWNGLMGIVEEGQEEGTQKIVEAIISSGGYSVVGGGDTVGYLQRTGVLEKFSFASTGGGAMLDFLAGEILPGIEVLRSS